MLNNKKKEEGEMEKEETVFMPKEKVINSVKTVLLPDGEVKIRALPRFGYVDKRYQYEVGDIGVIKSGSYKGMKAQVLGIGCEVNSATYWVCIRVENGDRMTYGISDELFEPKTITT